MFFFSSTYLIFLLKEIHIWLTFSFLFWLKILEIIWVMKLRSIWHLVRVSLSMNITIKGLLWGNFTIIIIAAHSGLWKHWRQVNNQEQFWILVLYPSSPSHFRERERKKKKKITFLTSHQSLRKVTLNVYGPKLTTSSLFPFALISFGCFCTCISSSLTCPYLHKNTHSHTLPIVLESWVHCICM